MDLKTQIYSIIKNPLEGFGYLIVEVNIKGCNKLVVEIVIEKKDASVSIEDCVKASKEVSAILDVEDVINKTYTLEVSSPGVCRALNTKEDFLRFVGEKVKLKTNLLIDGLASFKGVISKADNDGVSIILEENGNIVPILYEYIKSAKLNPDLKYR